MFDYSISVTRLPKFNETCPNDGIKVVDSMTGSPITGLFVTSLKYDCTTLLMYGVENLILAYAAKPDKIKNTITTIKRYMYYGNKNTCICTTVVKDVKQSLEKLGFICVDDIDSSRDKAATKYTLMLKVAPKKIGYPCWDEFSESFDTDPYLKDYV